MLRIRWERRIAGSNGVRPSSLVGMAVAAPALVAGCAQASSTIHVPSPTVTATPLPPVPLSWQPAPQQISIPAGMGSFPGAGLPSNFAVAPGDGNIAYACAVTLGAGAREASASVWVTHDRAAHWIEASNVAFGQVSSAPNVLRFCSMTVDQVDAKTAALVVVWQSTPDDFDLWHTSTLVTFDGGTTWQLLTSAEPAIIIQLATWQGSTYAIREVGVGCGSVCPVHPGLDSVVAIADDGAVLATLSGNPSASGGSRQVLLYRLSASATAWQALGTTPLTAVWYAPAPGTGVLWSLQLNGTPTANGLQSRFFTAAYP